ncbi:hypothetical protein ACQ28U_13495, partial [Staphylococcus cohnii]|uniref:hypothetical protein n=1 Tax=Staphylococcus cohnii TaxID=29382 RepID=UPI003D7E18D3
DKEIGIKQYNLSSDEFQGLFLCFFTVGFINFGEQKGGGTTTPLLSAECQIRDCEVFRPLISRVIAIFHKATNRLHL